jgi:FAM192A/Fyv6, N-terminal domain
LRLKHQFRPLEDDEAEFLDSVTKSKRDKEAAVRKETEVQLDSFRKSQSEVGRHSRTAETASPTLQSAQDWEFSGRKRKKADDKAGIRGVKLRKTSTQEESSDTPEIQPAKDAAKDAVKDAVKDITKVDKIIDKEPSQGLQSKSATKQNVSTAAASLVAGYSTDEDSS